MAALLGVECAGLYSRHADECESIHITYVEHDLSRPLQAPRASHVWRRSISASWSEVHFGQSWLNIFPERATWRFA